MDTIKFAKGNSSVKTVAHRGVSGLETENTCAAFVAAGNRSHFGIETDVHVTADGKFIIIHDDRTGRVAAEDLPVEGSTFDALRALPMHDKDGAPRGDLQLPALDEYVRICKKYEKTGVLELKNRMTPDDIAGIVNVIRACGYLDGIIFISFSVDNLYDLKKILPDAKAQWLCCDCRTETLDDLAAHGLDIDILYTELTADGVKAAHERGITVNCWTVDDPADAERLASWGVDMITSNILE